METKKQVLEWGFQLNRINPSGGASSIAGVLSGYYVSQSFQLNRINPSGGVANFKEMSNGYEFRMSFQLNRINPSGGDDEVLLQVLFAPKVSN